MACSYRSAKTRNQDSGFIRRLSWLRPRSTMAKSFFGGSRRKNCRFLWVRVYTSKVPMTAVQILTNHALPFFEDHG